MIHQSQHNDIRGQVDARHARAWLLGMASLAVLTVPSVSSGQVNRTSARQAPTMIYEGFTEPRYTIMVAATEIGRLDSVTVEVGDTVKQGQVIGQLEDALQASSVRIAQLQTEMVGELNATEAEAKLHRERTEKLRQLLTDGMARPDEVVRAETDMRIAVGRLAAAHEQLELRKLELARNQVQLERRKIRVPMDGVISQVFRQSGEYISPSDPSIVRLLVIDKLFAVFSIPVEDTPEIKVGSPAQVVLRSTAATIDAAISSIAPDIDGESGTVQVRVELDNHTGRLLPGDRCTLRLEARTAARPLPIRPTPLGRSTR
jgi:RND family efflux transporter MFP subunit